jgi:hypothetical protein
MPRARRSPLMNCIHYLMENSRDYLISLATPSSRHCSGIRRIEMAGHDAGPWMRQGIISGRTLDETLCDQVNTDLLAFVEP